MMASIIARPLGDFGRFIAKEVEKWDKVVEFSGVKIKAE
jgi:hypothetical protein